MRRGKKEIIKKLHIMSLLLKYAGIIVVLIGAAIIAIPFFTNSLSNGVLVAGLVIEIVGIFLTIFLGRMEK